MENYGRNLDPSRRASVTLSNPLALVVANPRSQAHIPRMVTIVQCNCEAEYRRTEEKFLVPYTGDAICTVCGAALELWSESTHVPYMNLLHVQTESRNDWRDGQILSSCPFRVQGSFSEVNARILEVCFAPINGLRQSSCQVRKVPQAKVGVSSVDHQLLDKRKFDPKRRAAMVPIFCRYLPIVRLDNGARDGQPHAHAFRLAGEKRFEDLF